MKPEDVTMVRNAIHNPAEPRHFMRVVPSSAERTASIDDQILASSSAALVVKEVAYDLYDPVVYFPRSAISDGALVAIDKTTHCPLKGDTEYFDVVVGDRTVPEAAWSYVETIGGAEVLRGFVAFDTSKVAVI